MAHAGHEATRPPDQPKDGEHEVKAVPPQSLPLLSALSRPPDQLSAHQSAVSQALNASSSSSQQGQGPATSVTLPRLPAGTPAALLSSFSKGAYTAVDATQQPAPPSAPPPQHLAPPAHGPSHSKFVPLLSGSACANHNDSSSSTSLTDLSDEDGEEAEDDEESSDGSTSRAQPTYRGHPSWTAEDNNLLFRSAARHDNSWAMVAAELEAAGGRKRSLASVASQYHRLRRKGFVLVAESGVGSSRSTPQRQDDGSSQRASSRRNPHLWTSDENAFLLRVGDKYSAPDVTNKEASIYAEWKKRYPSSDLNPHAVFVYYHYMKRQIEEPARKKQRGNTTSAASSAPTNLARPPPPRKAAPASFTQSFIQPIDSGSQRTTRPKPKPWDAAEVEALKRIRQIFKDRQINWHGTSALYDTSKRIMPRSERTAGGVQAKVRGTALRDTRSSDLDTDVFYAARYQYMTMFERGDEDSSDSGSGSEGSGSAEESGEEEDGEDDEDITMVSPYELSVNSTSQRQGARRASNTTAPTTASPTRASGSVDEPAKAAKAAPPAEHQSAPHHWQAPQPDSFTPSVPHTQHHTALSSLEFSFTIQENGMDFANVPSNLGIAISSRTSFKLLGPSQLAALAQAVGSPASGESLPAFVFKVLAGGGLETIRTPEGTKTGIEMLRAELGSGVGGRVGVESRLVGPCGFAIRVVSYL